MTVRVWSFSGSHAFVRCRQDHIATCKLKIQNEQQLRRYKRFHTNLVTASSTAVAPPQVSQQSTKPPQLPSALEKHVVQLTFTRHNKLVHIYILGMSHVSRDSCHHTAQLIATAKPDLVLLELCKDRTGLLLDPAQLSPQYWHSRTVTFDTGAGTQPASVQHACDSLLKQLRCQPGTAFSTHEIEQDCTKLLASGLFKSVVPVTQSASASDAPMFVYTANQASSIALRV